MNTWIIDCSVAAAGYLKEPGCDRATALLASGDELLAPDLIEPEFGNVLWKCVLRGEITEAEAGKLLASLRQSRIRRKPSTRFVQHALRLAIETKRTVYDCLYLAMAVTLDTVLYTGDVRFCNALQGLSVARHIAPISSYPLPS